jgi:hypothetical protein
MTKRFPRSESDITMLAVRVIDGLTNAAEDFPAPPVSPEELRGKLDTFQAADTATVAAETALRNQHEEKDEARFDPNAQSFAGAIGLMQMLPKTARGFGFDSLTVPEKSTQAGTYYLRHLYRLTDDAATPEDRLWFALASYNAGYGHVGDARRLTAELGGDPDVCFGGVDEGMPLLAKREYHSRTRYGYSRCMEPVLYIRRIRDRHQAYSDALGDGRWLPDAAAPLDLVDYPIF